MGALDVSSGRENMCCPFLRQVLFLSLMKVREVFCALLLKVGVDEARRSGLT